MDIKTTNIINDDDDDDYPPKLALKKKLKQEKFIIDNKKAEVVAEKFLKDNPDINIGCLIEQLKSMILSTTSCAEKLGISPSAFLRLRRKYKIEPVYTVKNEPNHNGKIHFLPSFSKKAIKNFYTPHQLNLIPQAEIYLIQMRSARSCNFPNGKNVPLKWKRRGYHSNGKIKARTDNLSKYRIFCFYNPENDRYHVIKSKGAGKEVLTKKEVDKLNCQYGKLKVFL